MLNDFSLMPSGKYLGRQLIDVPAKYLIWLYENNKCSAALRDYIEDNMDVLKKEIGDDNRSSEKDDFNRPIYGGKFN